MHNHDHTRLDYLDAARSFALILGIVFHASISFMPIFIGWAVMDISTNDSVPLFMLVSHSFRMALFFLVAGFFSHMTFRKLGLAGFLKSRLLRIAIPLVIGWLLLRPLLVSGWIIGAESMRGETNIANALLEGVKRLGQLPNEFLIGTHLWFLYYLLLICSIALVLHYLIGLHQPSKNRLTPLIDRATAWLCHSRFAILVLCIPSAAALWFMEHWGIDTPDKSLIPHIPVTVLYSVFFVFGWLLQRQSSLIDGFVNVSWDKLMLCIFAIAATITLSSYERSWGHPQYIWLKVCFVVNYAIMMWTLVSLTLGLCKRLFKGPSELVRYISDSSYWLYLIHLPLVIWLQIAFAELPSYWLIKLLSISAITIFVSIVIYDAAVRSTFVGAVLNGKRKPRVLFKLNKRQHKAATR